MRERERKRDVCSETHQREGGERERREGDGKERGSGQERFLHEK